MKKYLILFAVMILVIVFILFSLHTASNEQSPVTGDKFYKVLFAGNDLQSFLQEEGESNWKYLAEFKYAGKNSPSSEAVSIYTALANNENISIVLRDLAQYLKTMNSLDLKTNGEDLELITVYPYSAKEAMAIVKIYNDDIKGAVEILNLLLNDSECPISIKANAHELLQIYSK
ncbi:MAG: hypothetical protein QWI36_00220 [Wolbachia endosymbiont of Tyrophagus putrescentiae]|nr:hypothetical protein [Wolbachia endosymbiont of Tyrophagus putrescentiae]